MPAGAVQAATSPGGPETEPLSPRARRVAKTRRAIVESARSLFAERGYAHTTIDQIADRADIAPRTFFRYFPSKEALVFAEVDEMRQQVWVSLEARPAGEPPLESVIAALAEYADAIEHEHERLAWAFRLVEDDPALSYEVAALKTDTADRLTAFLAERLGVDPELDPRPTGWALTVIAIFGATLKTAFPRADASGHAPHPERPVGEVFLELVRETSGALKRALPR